MLLLFPFQVEIHEDFIQSCFDRLKASYDTLCVLDGDKDSINCARQEAIRMVRVLTVLKEYINECDSDYHEERTILPMSRSQSFRKQNVASSVIQQCQIKDSGFNKRGEI